VVGLTATERDRLIIVEGKIDAILEKMDSFTECQKDHESRIRNLENKPVKRWETVLTAIVTGLVGAVIGALFANIL
jgi:hypothetical protein